MLKQKTKGVKTTFPGRVSNFLLLLLTVNGNLMMSHHIFRHGSYILCVDRDAYLHTIIVLNTAYFSWSITIFSATSLFFSLPLTNRQDSTTVLVWAQCKLLCVLCNIHDLSLRLVDILSAVSGELIRARKTQIKGTLSALSDGLHH